MTQAIDLSQDDYFGWLRQKGKGIGGSDVGALMGLNKHRTPLDVFDAKLELRPQTPYNNDMRRGNVLEPVAADEFARISGYALVDPKTEKIFLKHPESPWLYGSPDRIMVAPSGRRGVLEIKCPRLRGFEEVKLEGIDPSYYAQLQWYMGLAQLQGVAEGWGAFAVFNAEVWETHHFDVVFDPAFFARAVEAAQAFWSQNVLPRVRPLPPNPLADQPPVVPAAGAEWVKLADEETVSLVRRWSEAKEQFKLVEQQEKMAKAAVEARMAALGHDAIRCSGLKIRYIEQARTSLDTDRLVLEHPTVDLAQYQTAKISRFLRTDPDKG